MKLLRLPVVICLLFLLAGCFQVTTLVRVNPDGSGTVEETVLFSKKMMDKVDKMARDFAGEGSGDSKPLDFYRPNQLKKQAASMGKGVRYHSAERVETADYQGYLAKYKFKDINTLKLSHKSRTPEGKDDSPKPLLRFRFKKGSTAKMTMVLAHKQREVPVPAAFEAASSPSLPVQNSVPDAQIPPEIFIPPNISAHNAQNAPEIYRPPAQPGAGEQNDERAKELAEIYLGMKFALAVEVNGTIISSDATYREGNRFTIFDFDFTKLSNPTPSELEHLSRIKNGSLDSIEDVTEMMKVFSGLKLELNEKLTVVFK